MEFILLFSASGKDYSEVLSRYCNRELTQDEIANDMYGKCAISFNSLEELIRFEDEVGDIVICDRFGRKAIIIYDDYLE